jgi:mono/diheme cytochrome c family protein
MRVSVQLLCLICLCNSFTALARIRSTPNASHNSPDLAGERTLATAPSHSPEDDALIATGKARFSSYKCYECHGPSGEGTDDGPDLVGTLLTADEISAFLQKPSADADAKGMPKIPADSPDLRPLVAFVVSLKRPQPKPQNPGKWAKKGPTTHLNPLNATTY